MSDEGFSWVTDSRELRRCDSVDSAVPLIRHAFVHRRTRQSDRDTYE